MSEELPEGWCRAPISTAFDLNPAKPRSDEYANSLSVTFVPMPAVDADAGAITKPSIRPFAEVRKGFTSFRDHDVIVAKITPCFENGKAAICRSLTNGLGFGSTEFHVLRPIGVVLPDYIYHFVRQESFRRDGAQNMTGSVGQKRVPPDWISDVDLPIAPLAEQSRIVVKVEQLLARVNAARARLAKVPAILKRFRQSVLAAACSGQLTSEWRESDSQESAAELVRRLLAALPTDAERGADFPVKRWRLREQSAPATEQLPPIPESWVWRWLPTLGYMNRGRSRNRPRNAPHLYGGRHPFIQTGDIAQSRGRIRQHKQTYSDAGLAQSRLWPTGTICITIAANIADSAMLTYPACFPDSVVGLIPDPELCVTEFAEFFIRTAREDLSQFAPATAQKNINIGILEQVAVPLPPIHEQREIVHRVESLFALADKIEARVQAATLRVEKNTQAILAKAFRGELVPTEAELAKAEGRDYEPASVLLERIRTEREAAKTVKPVRRRVPRPTHREEIVQ
jgi:type I restriction enzyme S subunit